MANKRPKRKYYEIAEEEGQHLSEKTDKDGWQRGLNFSDEKNKLGGPVRLREVDPGIEREEIKRDAARSRASAAKSQENIERYKANAERERRRTAEAELDKIYEARQLVGEVRGLFYDLRRGYNWVKYTAIPFVKFHVENYRAIQEQERQRQANSNNENSTIAMSTNVSNTDFDDPVSVIDKDTRPTITEEEYRALVMQWVGAVIQKAQAEKSQQEAEDALRSYKVEGHDSLTISEEKLQEIEGIIRSHPELMEPQFAISLSEMLRYSCKPEQLQKIQEVLPMPKEGQPSVVEEIQDGN